MAVEMLRFSKMDDQIAMQEAASAGLEGMDHLIYLLSHQNQASSNQLDCRELTDFTVSKFKKVISVLNRTGHARFRRGPISSSSSSPSSSSSASLSNHNQSQNLTITPSSKIVSQVVTPAPMIAQTAFVETQPQTLTLDFTKPNLVSSYPKSTEAVSTSQSFSLSTAMSSGNSSFMSSITADGSVSNGKLFVAPAPAVSVGKPPLSSSHKKRCHEHDQSDDVSGKHSGSEKCHCSKRRKSRVKRTIRVPAISSKIADIPADEYSWRKYGQKPIKGSPYPRGYYKCSSMRGCPARKHVEKDPDEPTMLIVTYEGEHRHSHPASQGNVVGGVGMIFEST